MTREEIDLMYDHWLAEHEHAKYHMESHGWGREAWHAAFDACSEAEGRWIPVGERLPHDDQFILAFGKHEMQIMAHFANGEFFAWNHETETWDDLIGHLTTHWMPLPAAPSRSHGESGK